jgi:GTP-binding protein
MERSFVVSFIGRPNVGKSTIFNRIMNNSHKAITFDEPGVTRDRHYGITSIEGLEEDFILIDTGGFYTEEIKESEIKGAQDKFFNLMKDHADQAIKESDLVLLVVDVREGLLPLDLEIAKFIRARKKDFWVLINKFDGPKQDGLENDFYSLGVDRDDMVLVSAEHGRGLEELRDRLKAKIGSVEGNSAPILQKGITPREDVVARMALIGAPNAGKSTLLNLLVGAERALVSDIPGTTVDPIDGYFDLFFGRKVEGLNQRKISASKGQILKQYDVFRKNNPDVYKDIEEAYTSVKLMVESTEEIVEEEVLEEKNEGSFWRSIHLVDTAGIRRKSNVAGFIESQSVVRSLRCINDSDIVLFMVDATQGISHQDRRLLGIALDKGKSVIICLNKIDLMNETMKDEKAKKEWVESLRYSIPWLEFCELIPISAKSAKNVKKLKEVIKKTILIRNRVIPTGELNRFVFSLIENNTVVPKGAHGKRLKLKYTSMVKNSPPTFLLFTNKSKGIPDNYRRYLQNAIRMEFGYVNTPIHLVFRSGADLSPGLGKGKH